jgi:hypothetical protein
MMSLPKGEEMHQQERKSGEKHLQTIWHAHDLAQFSDSEDLLRISRNQLSNMIQAT